MLQNTTQKYTALAISIIVIILALWQPANWYNVGIYNGAPLWQRLTYHFFHANIIHATLNVWCFLSCVFIANMSWRQITTALIIATAAPNFYSKPTIGLSGVCFAMIGIISFYARRKILYHIYILTSIISVWMLLGNRANNVLHLFCYATATASEFFYKLYKNKKT